MRKQEGETVAPLSIDRYEVVNDILVIKWNDGEESYVSLKTLRDNCPCAGCAGEKDALGNIHVITSTARGEKAYELEGLNPVGYYAVQPVWGDGHNTGIFRFELLKELGEREDS